MNTLCSAVLSAVVLLLPSVGQSQHDEERQVGLPGAVADEPAPGPTRAAPTALPDALLTADAAARDGTSDLRSISGLRDPDPRLSEKEVEALSLVRRWLAAKDSPTLSENGQVRFLFGATLPVIVCAPLRGTDIALQPGEIVKPGGVHTGDSVRWQVMPAMSGPVGNETTHLIVKPTDVGLSTNMIIGTDRRTYHVELIARKEDWMPSVGFNYPEEIQAKWGEYQRKTELAKTANTIPETGENIQTLDFNYSIEGSAPWKPLRVYNNGVKTIVQMPSSMKAIEAPALLILGDHNKEQIVNYRLRGDRFIVDFVFQKAVLILGVGRNQTRVTISRVE